MSNIHLGSSTNEHHVSEHQAAYQPHAVSAVVLQSSNQELRKQHFSLGYGSKAMLTSSTHKADFVDHGVAKMANNSAASMAKFTDHWSLGNDAGTYVSESKAAFARTAAAPAPTLRSRVASDRANLMFGTDALDYKTTSEISYKEIADRTGVCGPEEGRRRATELRKSHLNLSSSEAPDFRSSYEADFIAHSLPNQGAADTQSSQGEVREKIVFGNYPAQFESESRHQYGRDVAALVKACAEVSRPRNAGHTNIVLGSAEGGFTATSEAQSAYVPQAGARPPAVDSQSVRKSSIYLSGSTASENRSSVARDAYVAYSQVDKAQSLKPRGGTNVVLGYERGATHKTIEKEMMEQVYTNSDQLASNKRQTEELKTKLRSRHTNFLLGTDDREYLTTSKATFTEHRDGKAGVLADQVKRDLRATHYILGDSNPDYLTTTSAAHVAYNVADAVYNGPVQSKVGTSVVIGNVLPGDMPPRTVAQDSYRWPMETAKNL